MMKRTALFLFGFVIYSALCLADYSDGFITAGEYEYGVQLFNHDVLIVEGGGLTLLRQEISAKSKYAILQCH